MPDEILIRKAHAGDLTRVYEMMCSLEKRNLSRDDFRDVFLMNIASEGILYLVAVLSGEPSGFIGVHFNRLLHHGGKVAEIQELYINACSRNRGIGKKLVAEAERLCSLDGVKEIEVTSNKLNTSAHRFYETVSYIQSHLKFTKRLLP